MKPSFEILLYRRGAKGIHKNSVSTLIVDYGGNMSI